MINFGNISISLNVNWLLLTIFALAAALYTFYIFKYTVPQISVRLKTFFMRSRNMVSPQVISMGGRNWPSGNMSLPSAEPLMPT